jgi:hypothetical protein
MNAEFVVQQKEERMQTNEGESLKKLTSGEVAQGKMQWERPRVRMKAGEDTQGKDSYFTAELQESTGPS